MLIQLFDYLLSICFKFICDFISLIFEENFNKLGLLFFRCDYEAYKKKTMGDQMANNILFLFVTPDDRNLIDFSNI
jgi:hypothetical protein